MVRVCTVLAGKYIYCPENTNGSFMYRFRDSSEPEKELTLELFNSEIKSKVLAFAKTKIQ